MSTGQAAPTSPPEVPDEFAAAYREAYERALRDQTDAPRHRHPAQYRPGYVAPTVTVAAAPLETVAARPPRGPAAVAARPPRGPASVEARPSVEPVETPDVDLPERQGRLVVGTHRAGAAMDLEDTWFDGLRESRLFVPALLMALAALLVLGAYVLGRVFSAAVG